MNVRGMGDFGAELELGRGFRAWRLFDGVVLILYMCRIRSGSYLYSGRWGLVALFIIRLYG